MTAVPLSHAFAALTHAFDALGLAEGWIDTLAAPAPFALRASQLHAPGIGRSWSLANAPVCTDEVLTDAVRQAALQRLDRLVCQEGDRVVCAQRCAGGLWWVWMTEGCDLPLADQLLWAATQRRRVVAAA